LKPMSNEGVEASEGHPLMLGSPSGRVKAYTGQGLRIFVISPQNPRRYFLQRVGC
jgi:hypothetical protein